ncbi:MAG: nitrogen fixation protein NifQ [Burkholderiales bacterium]|nr:nitrogen fixation protein NifQ [Burkholderiales bacterium]
MGGTLPAQCTPSAMALPRRATRDDEVIDLVALLLAHADPTAGAAPQREWVAEQLAVACLGDNHLWQDLLLASRRELSALFERWFPALAAKNTHDMKWKKFLYKQLCEREALFICKAPSCAVCADRPTCFGPEA